MLFSVLAGEGWMPEAGGPRECPQHQLLWPALQLCLAASPQQLATGRWSLDRHQWTASHHQVDVDGE